MSGRSVSIWIAGAILALVSASHTLSLVAANSAPSFARAMLPANGRALAAYADHLLKQATLEAGGQFPQALPREAGIAARRAYALEPLDPVAVRMVALDVAGAGEKDRARALMLLADRLSRRDRVVNYWLTADYEARGDTAMVLHHYDLLLRTNRTVYEQLVPPMALALANEALIEPLANLLRRDPPWARVLWTRIANTQVALVNAARLRAIMGADNRGIPAAADAALVRNLVNSREYAAAHNLRMVLDPRGSRGSGVVNGDFKAEPRLPPFDWQLAAEGDLGAGIDPAGGTMVISALPDAAGAAARQLVRLEQGAYDVGATVKSRLGRGAELELRLSCADRGRGDATLARLKLARGANRAAFETDGCEFFWLQLYVTVERRADPVDIEIGEITVSRAQAATRSGDKPE